MSGGKREEKKWKKSDLMTLCKILDSKKSLENLVSGTGVVKGGWIIRGSNLSGKWKRKSLDTNKGNYRRGGNCSSSNGAVGILMGLCNFFPLSTAPGKSMD